NVGESHAAMHPSFCTSNVYQQNPVGGQDAVPHAAYPASTLSYPQPTTTNAAPGATGSGSVTAVARPAQLDTGTTPSTSSNRIVRIVASVLSAPRVCRFPAQVTSALSTRSTALGHSQEHGLRHS